MGNQAQGHACAVGQLFSPVGNASADPAWLPGIPLRQSQPEHLECLEAIENIGFSRAIENFSQLGQAGLAQLLQDLQRPGFVLGKFA